MHLDRSVDVRCLPPMVFPSKFSNPTRKKRCRELASLITNYASQCFYCQGLVSFSDAERAPTRDHVIPVAAGHIKLNGNSVLACRACNFGKQDTIPSRCLILKFVRYWSLATLASRQHELSEVFSDFQRDQYIITVLELLVGEPNIPGTIRSL